MTRRLDDEHYRELAAAAERGDLKPIPGTEVHGEAAAAFGREVLMWATSTDNIDDARRVALGRPPLGVRANEASWRVRTTNELDRRAKLAAQREGVSLAQFIRDAVDQRTRDFVAA